MSSVETTALAHRLDLSQPACHVCGRRLDRDLIGERERCTNFECSARGVSFSIPYIVFREGDPRTAA